ncbi:MAG: rod shape-determining protein RodA [bacterium]|nr:rod shape-determining protein RodA [bacterium]
MWSSIFVRIGRFDWVLLLAVGVLFAFGATAIYSVGLGKDPQDFGFFYKQLATFGLGFFIMMILGLIHYRLVRNFSVIIFLGACLLLVTLLVFGNTVRGTKGWFLIGGMGFQPVEFVKIALIIFLAAYFDKYTRQITQLRHIFISGAIAFIPIILVALQPDFGSAVVLFLIWFGMILVSGIPKRYFLIMVTMIIMSIGLCWLFVFKDYQKDRIISFINPQHDTQGANYNVLQAQIAVGSGQIFGRGLGSGSQSHLKFLPENQTDFIFAVLAEEMGLLGSIVVLLFWVLLFYRLSRGMHRARDDYALFVCLGVALMFGTGMIINIGGTVGIIPVTGLVLPFMSYGGSSLLASMIGIGLVQGINSHT